MVLSCDQHMMEHRPLQKGADSVDQWQLKLNREKKPQGNAESETDIKILYLRTVRRADYANRNHVTRASRANAPTHITST